MHIRDWKLFLEGQYENVIAIAQLSKEMTDYLGASSHFVHIERACLVKAVRKHQLEPAHFPLIFETVDYGLALTEDDRPRHITFLYFDGDIFQNWFQVSVKRAHEDRRIYVSTFHRTSGSEVLRKTRKHTVIRLALK